MWVGKKNILLFITRYYCLLINMYTEMLPLQTQEINKFTTSSGLQHPFEC